MGCSKASIQHKDLNQILLIPQDIYSLQFDSEKNK